MRGMRGAGAWFTEAELTALRARADAEGRSMRKLAHDVLTERTTQAAADSRVMEAAGYVVELSRDLLKRLADR